MIEIGVTVVANAGIGATELTSPYFECACGPWADNWTPCSGIAGHSPSTITDIKQDIEIVECGGALRDD